MTQLAIDFAAEIKQAQVAGDEGIRRACEHAETDKPGWTTEALRYLQRYAERHQEFAGFMVTMQSELDASFPKPETTKAWGQVYRLALKGGLIEKTGRDMPHPRRHGCPAEIYRSLVWVELT